MDAAAFDPANNASKPSPLVPPLPSDFKFGLVGQPSPTSPSSPTRSSGHGHQWSCSASSRASTPPPLSAEMSPSSPLKHTLAGLSKPIEQTMAPSSTLEQFPPLAASPPFPTSIPLYDQIRNGQDSSESPLFPSALYWLDAHDATVRTSSAFSDDLDGGHDAKRRRSAESTLGALKHGIVSRLPSFSGRSRQQRRVASTPPSTPAPGSSCDFGTVPGSSPGHRSRSGSVRSFFRRSESCEAPEESVGFASPQSPRAIETIDEDEDDAMQDVVLAEQPLTDKDSTVKDPVDSPIPRATTPILPNVPCEPDTSLPTVSPLVSPTIAFGNILPAVQTPGPTPQTTHQNSPLPTPTHEENKQLAPIAAGFPFMDERGDAWSQTLGHADFHITPKPYIPDICDQRSADALLAAWSSARREFSRHLARTATNFGPQSPIYELTEKKWAEIDTKWRDNFTVVATEAARREGSPPADPARLPEPQPIARMPAIPHDDGKFPQLANGEIYCTMEKQEPRSAASSACPSRVSTGMTVPQQPSSIVTGDAGMQKPSAREKFAKMLGQLPMPGRLSK